MTEAPKLSRSPLDIGGLRGQTYRLRSLVREDRLQDTGVKNSSKATRQCEAAGRPVVEGKEPRVSNLCEPSSPRQTQDMQARE